MNEHFFLLNCLIDYSFIRWKEIVDRDDMWFYFSNKFIIPERDQMSCLMMLWIDCLSTIKTKRDQVLNNHESIKYTKSKENIS